MPGTSEVPGIFSFKLQDPLLLSDVHCERFPHLGLSLLSAYTYAAANPLKYVDPTGEEPIIAVTGFVLGENYEKHEQGDVTISVRRRAKLTKPKITFGGRYSNNAKGQKLYKSIETLDDNINRYTTILSISKEDGVKKIRVFGVTVKKIPAPDAAPGDSGAEGGGPDLLNLAEPAGAPPNPGLQADINDAPDNPAGAGGEGDGPGDAGAAAPPPDVGGDGQDAPTSAQPGPPGPPRAAAGAQGPELD